MLSKTAAPTPPVDPTTALIAAMADKVREMSQNGVPVTAESLAAQSEFTLAECKRHGQAACDRAKELDRENRRAA